MDVTGSPEDDERVVNDIKREIAADLSTLKYGLTSQDRHLLKSYLGYTAVKDLHNGRKEKSNSCDFVQSTLWPTGLTEEERSIKNTIFDIESYCRPRTNEDIPQMFSTLNENKELTKMFDEASRFTDIQESGVIRSFQVRFF